MITDSSGVINWMKKLNIPITRQNFIDFNWGGTPPDPWSLEAEAQIPTDLQDWSVFGKKFEDEYYGDEPSEDADEDDTEDDPDYDQSDIK